MCAVLLRLFLRSLPRCMYARAPFHLVIFADICGSIRLTLACDRSTNDCRCTNVGVYLLLNAPHARSSIGHMSSMSHIICHVCHIWYVTYATYVRACGAVVTPRVPVYSILNTCGIVHNTSIYVLMVRVKLQWVVFTCCAICLIFLLSLTIAQVTEGKWTSKWDRTT